MGDVVVQVFDVSLMAAAVSAVRVPSLLSALPPLKERLLCLREDSRRPSLHMLATLAAAYGRRSVVFGVVFQQVAKRLARIHDGDLEFRHLSGLEGARVLVEVRAAPAAT
ncbi:MAG: hypothetical protein ACKPKO_41690, partial [Candidatus Fonsibacter sp.]